MEAHIIILTLLGIVILLTAWLPMALRRLPLSLPIFCIVLGVAIALSPFSPITANPFDNRHLTERFSELVVIVALMGAGLKLDRPIGWRGWMSTWRLLGFAMPLTVAAIAIVGWIVLGLPVASAILLGAALAPTDPVLASDVQVGPPRSGKEDDVRFSLTSEAGLNDGLSFPFVYLAIAIASAQSFDLHRFAEWFAVDVIWRIAAGLFCGWLTGRALGFLTFRLPKNTQLAKSGDGLVAIGLTFLCYGVTEMADGYGFVAVFVAALTLRSVERQHEFHENLHNFTDQIERLLMMVLMVFFGMIIGDGTVVSALTWKIVLAALLTIFLIRPIIGWASLGGLPQPFAEKAIIGFFGIRGVGSFYYIAFATGQVEFGTERTLWVTVFLIVLISVVTHGTTVTPIMRRLDQKRAARAASSSSAA
ncbi:sodium:proton antiporter [Sinorhizobium numidicum]|uniref:Sodium:proton antiporter n=1 Tax=Sinorhizobium numidicum TaxID=680248 RepID=A0ABY8CP42_9HYPH|nr:sodium:proton antiporter [Sinorhizobium numidicum]WEX73942.1 sodium:proton antiporter [Sinorhizobium numidicum]WEX79927.1 sodium:proton antiporter [Sinorhizobium numidicum]